MRPVDAAAGFAGAGDCVVKISPAQISVVIQGPVLGGPELPRDQRFTVRAIASVRRVLPSAQIVLSTWEGSDTSGLEVDRLVTSPDPGGYVLKNPGYPDYVNNVNRQLASTLSGLRAADREFAIKLRTDCELLHDGFLNGWEDAPRRSDSLRVFESPVVCGELFTRDPRILSYLFHPADIFHFGRREDLLRFWDVPSAPAEETVAWRDRIKGRVLGGVDGLEVRYVPEQYLWISALRKAGHDFQLGQCCEIPRELIEPSELSILNNFRIVDERSLGVVFPSGFLRHGVWKTYSRQEALRLYELYCVRGDRAEIEARVELVAHWASVRRRRWMLDRFFFGIDKLVFGNEAYLA